MVKTAWPAVLCGKSFDVEHNAQNVQPTSTIGFYDLIPLSAALTLVKGHKINEKQNLLPQFS